MRAITLGKNSKGEWTLIHSPDVPIGEQQQHFDVANLKTLPKGVVEVWHGLIEEPNIRRTIGPKGGLVEAEAAAKRAKEKAEIQKRIDEENLIRIAKVNPQAAAAAAAEIDRLKGKKPAAVLGAEPKAEPATK